MADRINNNNETPLGGMRERGIGADKIIGSLNNTLGSIESQMKDVAAALRLQAQSNADIKKFLASQKPGSDKDTRRGRYDSEIELSRAMSSMATNLKDLKKDLATATKGAREDSWRVRPKSKNQADLQTLSSARTAAVLDAYTEKMEALTEITNKQIIAWNEFITAQREEAKISAQRRKDLADERIRQSQENIVYLKTQRSEAEDQSEIEAITRKILKEQATISKEHYAKDTIESKLNARVDKIDKEGSEPIIESAKKEMEALAKQREEAVDKIVSVFSGVEEAVNNVRDYTADMRGLSPAFEKMMDDVDETYSENFNKAKDTLLSGIKAEREAIVSLLKADAAETDVRKKLAIDEKERLRKELIVLKKQEEYLKRTGPIQDIWRSAGDKMKSAALSLVEGFADLGFKYLEDKYFKSYQEGFQKVYDSIESTRNAISARLKLTQGGYKEMQEKLASEIEARNLSGSISPADVDEMLVSLQGAGVTDEDMLTELSIQGALLKAQGSSINLGNEKTLQVLRQMYDSDIKNGATQEEALSNMTNGINSWAQKEIYVRQELGDSALVNGGIDTIINTVGDLWASTGQSAQEGFESIGDTFLAAQKTYNQGYDATELIQSVQGMLDKQYSEYTTMEKMLLSQGMTRDKILSQSITDSMQNVYEQQKSLLDQTADMYLPEVSNVYGFVGSVQDQRKMKVGEELTLTVPEDMQSALNDIAKSESEAISEGTYLSETERTKKQRENQMTQQAIEAEQMYKGDMLVNGTLDNIDKGINDIYNILKASLLLTGKSWLEDLKKGAILDDSSVGKAIIKSQGGSSGGAGKGLSLDGVKELLHTEISTGAIKENVGNFAFGKSGTALGTAGKVAGGAVGAAWMVSSITNNMGDTFQETFENVATDPKFYRGLGTTLGSAIAGPVGGAVGAAIGQGAGMLGNALADPIADLMMSLENSDYGAASAQEQAADRLSAAAKSLQDAADAQLEKEAEVNENILQQREIFNKYDVSQQKQFIKQMEVSTEDKSVQEAFREAIKKWEDSQIAAASDSGIKGDIATNTQILSAAVNKSIGGFTWGADEEVQKDNIRKLVEEDLVSPEALSYLEQYGQFSESQKKMIDAAWQKFEEKRTDLTKIQNEEGYKNLAAIEEQALKDFAEKNKLLTESGAADIEAARKQIESTGEQLDIKTATKQVYAEQLMSGNLSDEDIATAASYADTLYKNREEYNKANAQFQSQWAEIKRKHPGANLMDLVAAYNEEHLGSSGISVADAIDGFTVDSAGIYASYAGDAKGNPVLKYRSSGGTRMYDPKLYAGKFESGLTDVPIDGYPAILHEGERVLTREEAQAYNDMSSSIISNYARETNYAGSTISTVGTNDIKNAVNSNTNTTSALLKQILETMKEISASLKQRNMRNPMSKNVSSMNTNLTVTNN